MTEQDPNAGTGGEPEDIVARQAFDVSGPLDVDLAIITGRISVLLVDEPGASVEVRHDRGSEGGWFQQLGGLVNWLGEQFGDIAPLAAGPAEAVQETRIELTGRRLTVRAPQGRFHMVPLAVTIRVPAGSNLEVRSGSANLTATGPAGRVMVKTASGEIALDRADGPAEISAGSGALRLGPMLGGLRARSGSGEIDVSSVGGQTTIITGSGDVWLGAVQADVMARTGSGDLTVADAASGTVELLTGSGDIRVGVRSGKVAEIDLMSGSGQARSELTVSDRPPAEETRLRVRGRTGSGAVLVTAAVG